MLAAAWSAQACTSGATGGASTTPAPAGETARDLERPTNPAFDVSLTVTAREHADTVPVPPARALALLPQVYRDLGLGVSVVDAPSQSIASPLLRIHQSLGRVPLSRLIDCGKSAYGSNADVQEITMRVRSTVEPAGSGGSAIRSIVRAAANPQGTGSNQFRCGTTRGLERRIAELVAERSR
jgi:hypothetical protein